MQKDKKTKIYKICTIILFMIYIVGVLEVTLARGAFYGSEKVALFDSYKEAWYFATWPLWRNIILNMVLFMPFGVLLPMVSGKMQKFRRICLTGFLFSFCVESAQYLFSRGIFEGADLLNNTLGAMIGYGIYILGQQIILLFQRKNGSVKKVLLAQVPLFAVILTGGLLYFIYQIQEYGNLEQSYCSAKDMSGIQVKTDQKYKTQVEKVDIYRTKVYSAKETEKLAKSIFKQFGAVLDERRTLRFDDSAFYWGKISDTSPDNQVSLEIDYRGGTYRAGRISEQMEEKSDDRNEISKEEAISALTALQIQIPEYGEYSYNQETKNAQFYIPPKEGKTKQICGTLTGGDFRKGTFGHIYNQLVEVETYKSVSAISEQDAYEKIKSGQFFGKISGVNEIVAGKVKLEYRIDSKGFYRPVYVFAVKIDGEMSTIEIPADQ